jgi:hypothetical protein
MSVSHFFARSRFARFCDDAQNDVPRNVTPSDVLRNVTPSDVLRNVVPSDVLRNVAPNDVFTTNDIFRDVQTRHTKRHNSDVDDLRRFLCQK